MNNNKNTKKTYSTNETRNIVDKYIEKSAKRLQDRLLLVWKKQTSVKKKRSYAKNSI